MAEFKAEQTCARWQLALTNKCQRSADSLPLSTMTNTLFSRAALNLQSKDIIQRNGQVTKVIVERQDEGFLQHALCLANTGYIVYRHNGKVVQLHRMILGLQQGDCQVVDHINRVKTDNRRNNLRLVSYSQNGANMMRKKKLKGVRKHGRRFIARAGFMYKSIHLGCFDTAEQAAAKYNEFMSQKHGIHARLNVI